MNAPADLCAQATRSSSVHTSPREEVVWHTCVVEYIERFGLLHCKLLLGILILLWGLDVPQEPVLPA